MRGIGSRAPRTSTMAGAMDRNLGGSVVFRSDPCNIGAEELG
jgi:hypothetical protein